MDVYKKRDFKIPKWIVNILGSDYINKGEMVLLNIIKKLKSNENKNYIEAKKIIGCLKIIKPVSVYEYGTYKVPGLSDIDLIIIVKLKKMIKLLKY